MISLLLDTHTNKIIIVLYKDEKILVKKEIETSFNHSETTMPSLIQVLNEANYTIKDVKEIICVNGPGSFTGVRIGVTIAKMLAYTLSIPIKTMSSLLIKAVSFKHDVVNIIEQEKNGAFKATFNKNNELVGDYVYYLKNELEKQDFEYIDDIVIDYISVLKFSQKLNAINPHLVKPLYVKKIEVLK